MTDDEDLVVVDGESALRCALFSFLEDLNEGGAKITIEDGLEDPPVFHFKGDESYPVDLYRELKDVADGMALENIEFED